jgi:hypothetical protein
MEKPIKKIKFGVQNYKLCLVDMLGDDLGEADSVNQKIRIFIDVESDLGKVTLLHECLHVLLDDVIYSTQGLNNEDKEEAMIRLLSPRLLAFLKDNKDLVKFLQC